jgi:hypothetical protein
MTRRLTKKRSGEFLNADMLVRLSGPQTLAQWHELFPDEASCRRYLAALRWPGGFACPTCEHAAAADVSQRALMRCSACGTVCSPTTGTALDDVRLPLRAWFRAIWEIARTESGADPAAIARVLPLPREDFVWGWLTRLRDVYRLMWRRQLHGVVEVAKVPVEVLAHRGSSHCMVAVAAEDRGSGLCGRIRVERLVTVDRGSITSFVQRAVAPGSCVRTTNWSGYSRLRSRGYGHIVALTADGSERLQHAAQIASLLRLWLRGTKTVTHARLDYYLDEFTYRLGIRLEDAANDRAALFNGILRLAVQNVSTPRRAATASA